MSGAVISMDIVNYIEKTKWAILATVRKDNAPVLRTMGSFAQEEDGRVLYFSTYKGTQKARQIEENSAVALFFQHEGQELGSFRNVAVIGDAVSVADDRELVHAIGLLNRRTPFLKERIDSGELDRIGIYRVRVREIKHLDFSKGFDERAVEEIRL